MTVDRRRRRRTLLVAAAVWIGLGVILLVVVGGATGFIPDDPTVPQLGFVDAGDGRVAVEVGPTSLAQSEGIEVRSGSEPRNGRMLWRIKRTARASGTPDGRIVVGTVPPGFDEVTRLAGSLPRLWHVEVDNRCYFASAVVPTGLRTDAVTLSSGERVTPAGFRAADTGFSDCDTNSLGGRVAAFAGLVSIAVGGVLVLAFWWDLRRGLPAELS